MGLKRPWKRDNGWPPAPPPPDPDLDLEEDGTEVVDMSGPRPGECRPGICGEEAACKKLPNSTYICLCPHDSSPPTVNLKCPNRLTVPVAPQPIHNIIPPSGGISTTSRSNASTTTQRTEQSSRPDTDIDIITVSGAALLAFILITTFIGICLWKRKSISSILCKDKSTRKVEAPRTAEPLLAERYISNPQYSSEYTPGSHNSHGAPVPQIQRDALTFIEEIGEGFFGKVYKGELRAENKTVKTVAIKALKESASRTAEDDFNREVSIMSAFQHENILTLMGVVQKADSGHSPWMVFEYMPFGDLVGVLRSNSHAMRQTIPGLPPLDTKALLSIAFQIARGMKYLAAQRFVHRDLACRNCLVGQGLTVKIADFGMSRDVYTCDYYKMGGNRPMPIRWMSPESIVYARFTLESDVWSYGVVLWEIYSLGKQPFYGHNNDGASKLILQGIMLIPPEDCPTFICEIMKGCWRNDPKDRIRFENICEKLQLIFDNGGWEGLGGSGDDNRENWTKSLGRASLGGRLPRPPPILPDIPPCPPSPLQHQLTDPEGYLLPTSPVLISDYITALPD